MRTMTLLLVSIAVSSAIAVKAEPSASWAEARTAAMAAIEIAAGKGHAWSTSDSLFEEAARAAEEGDESRAISLADEARIHAELAAVQADREATAWHDNVIAD